MMCFRKILVAKKFMDRTGGGVGLLRFSLENFLYHSSEKIRRGILQCFINFGYRKKLGISRGGVSRVSVKNFLCHSAEKLGRVTLL